jgi:hypothetical protein
VLEFDTVSIAGHHARRGHDLHALLGQRALGIIRQVLRQRRQDARSGLNEDNACRGRVDAAEILRQALARDFGNGAGHLDPRRRSRR